MKEIQLPKKIQIEEKGNSTGIVVIEPLYPGYGLTLGNALRRVLISSLSGAAVTAVKIKGVQHEFSTIPYVKEDVVDIILNIKLLRFKLLQNQDNDAAVIARLKVKGEKVVTGRDIEASSEVEVVSPDLKIATLTDKKAELEIEFTIKNGLGYLPVESREKEKTEIGAIAVDAIFTPILKARFELENVRVEQMTNYDRLTLEVVTDGSITPSLAIQNATKILNDHFTYLLEAFSGTKKAQKEEEQIVEEKAEEEKESKKEEKSEEKKEKKAKKAEISEEEDKKQAKPKKSKKK